MTLRKLFILAVAVLTSTAASNLKAADEGSRPDSLNRSVAVVMSSSLDPIIQNLTNAGLEVDRAEIGRYIAEILGGKDMGMTPKEANAYVEQVLHESSQLSLESQLAYVAEQGAQPGAVTTPSGLVFQVIMEGEGVSPDNGDKVEVRYKGQFSDGTVFDDTGDEIVTFDLESEIPGFIEGLKMMKPGGTYRIVVPPELAYGSEGIPGIIPGNAALVFTVNLERVSPADR